MLTLVTSSIYSLKCSVILTSISFYGENKYSGLIVIFCLHLLFCFVVLRGGGCWGFFHLIGQRAVGTGRYTKQV